MKILGLARYAFGACGVVAMLAGCSAGSQVGPSPIAQNAVTAPNKAALRRSWMAPDLNLKKKDLLYIASSGEILVFTYPGGKLVGTLTGIPDPGSECTSNTSMGNWWVVTSGEIFEYAHGGTSPISTLNAAGAVSNCAVDPTTGNLAASILNNGDVVIFAGAKGSGTVMTTPLLEAFFDGYDNEGNLFVDGFNNGYAFGLVELPKGSSSFKMVTLNQSIEFPGAIQGYGKDLAVGDQETSNVYQFAISGTNGTLKATAPLEGAIDVASSWIQKHDVVGADAGNNDAAVWRYPAGGMPIKTICSSCFPLGVVVSVAPSKQIAIRKGAKQ
jgi:hypothetical protein